MRSIAFTGGGIVTPGGVLYAARIDLADGRIAAIGDIVGGEDARIDLAGGWLMPGFIDTQVNGGAGVLFNDEISVEGIAAIGAAHRAYGTTAFLPTLISDGLDKVAAALDAAEAAVAAGIPGVVGVHIEGPFLNVARKGIHDDTRFRRIDPDAIALLTRPRAARVMLTLAPELCTPADIAALARGGVRVSIGHSEADYETVVAAIDAGMTGFTHVFNAMSPLLHRAPGAVGAAMDDARAWCGLIADGAHVHPAVLRIALKAIGPERIMLVTDAMPSVGATSKDFTLQGRAITVANGICVDSGGTLAGSDLDMAQAVRNMVTMTGIAPPLASAMASATPAAFLGLADRGALAPGLRADWVVMDAGLQPRETWIGGRPAAD